MRMLMQVKIPNQEFNAAVHDGTVSKKMQRILEENRPESVFFTEIGGQRCGILIVDVEEPSRVPAYAEPWFLTFNASVEFHVVMTADDLAKAGLDKLGKHWK